MPSGSWLTVIAVGKLPAWSAVKVAVALPLPSVTAVVLSSDTRPGVVANWTDAPGMPLLRPSFSSTVTLKLLPTTELIGSAVTRFREGGRATAAKV